MHDRQTAAAAQATDATASLSFKKLSTLALIFAVATIPFAVTPIIPTIDFYNHVARYFILSELSTDPSLARNYAENWSLLPNIGLDVIGVWIIGILDPVAGAKILLIIILITQYTGVIFFNRQVSGRYSVLCALLSAPLLYSYIFFWGFANFLFGLGLTFWAAGWWLAMRRSPQVALPVACLLAITIYLAHGLAFALYGALLASLELGLFLTSRDRRVSAALRRLAALIVQAIVPVAMFLSTATAESAAGITNADESLRRLLDDGDLSHRIGELVLYRLQTIVRVAEGPVLWFDVVSLVGTLGVLLILGLRGRVSVPKFVWPSIGVGVLLVAFVPPALFGVGYVADRMPLFLALIVVGSLSFQLRGDDFERGCIAGLVILVAVRIGYLGADWFRYRAEFAEFRSVAQLIPPRSVVAGIDVSLGRQTSPTSRCEMYGPLLVLLDRHAGPLFANATQQPLTLIGRLNSAVHDLPSSAGAKDAPTYYSDYIARAYRGGHFDYILICNAHRLHEPFPLGAHAIAKAGRFTLLRLHSTKPDYTGRLGAYAPTPER